MQNERNQILKDAATHRAREIMYHQINIDNYRLAIAEIEQNHAGDANLTAFAARLGELLESSLSEQAKEKIMLKVIVAQLGDEHVYQAD
jgi:hypothetical protein